MKYYDLVADGQVVQEKVRFNVCAHSHHGHSITHGDVTALEEEERHECGIYERIDPAPIYDGRFEKFGDKSKGVVDDEASTVTYTTPIIPLSIDLCRAHLLKRTGQLYKASADSAAQGEDLDAIKEDHVEAINALVSRDDIVEYDTSLNWPINFNEFQ